MNKDNKSFRLNINNLDLSPLLFIFSTVLILIASYNLYDAYNKVDLIERNYLLINNGLILLVTITFCLTFIKKFKPLFKTLSCTALFSFLLFNVLVSNNIISLKTQELMPNLIGMEYKNANNWAKDNNIVIEPIYEYSDNYKENEIISQNITTNTLLKNVKTLTLIISLGPNYDKKVIVSNYSGRNIDEVLKELDKNFLNNITVNYIKDDHYDKDIIIEQNIKGELKRNDNLIFTVSLGIINEEVKMIDLINKSLFDASLFLNRNGIKYNVQYEYSDIKRGNVISTSVKLGDKINVNNDTIYLIVSKGKEIKVPNILSMDIDEVTTWISNNNLKITYYDTYDDNVALGRIIKCNYKENDIIEEGTQIEITTSKGPLKMEKFNNLNDFKSWAEKYKVAYREEYQFNDSVSKGNIIKFSITEGNIIPNNETIVVYLSNGKAITIPNFNGKSKTDASNLCRSLGLNCSFTYGSYGGNKDTVTNQSKSSGNTVVSGTYITLTLSKGKPSSCTIYIQPTWFGSSADETIASLKKYLSAELNSKGCKDVSFNYKKAASNEGASGLIHPNSNIKGGNNTFTDGNTYTITVINN